MYRFRSSLAAVGTFVLLVVFGGPLFGVGQGTAEAQTYDFTFTSEDTVETSALWDTAMFYAILENTGTEIDSYYVTLTENSPTPEEWWVEFCAGGVCWDSLVTTANSYLEPGWTDQVELHVMPRTEGQGNFTITVESYGNPGAKMTKSITFFLSAHPGVPVTNQWGLIVLVGLILTSGLYLAYRRLKLVRQS